MRITLFGVSSQNVALATLGATLLLCGLTALAGAQSPTNNPLVPDPTKPPRLPTATLVNGHGEVTPGAFAQGAFTGGVPTRTPAPTTDPILATVAALQATLTAALASAVPTNSVEPASALTPPPAADSASGDGVVQSSPAVPVTQSMLDMDQPAPGDAILDGQPLVVSGWAVSAAGGATIIRVTIFIDSVTDGGRLGDAQYGMPRPDASTTFGRPDWQNTGFQLVSTVSGIAGGRHTIFAAAYRTEGDPLISNVDFEIITSQ